MAVVRSSDRMTTNLGGAGRSPYHGGPAYTAWMRHRSLPKLVLSHTDVRVLSFLPELRLRVATDAIGLWEAIEGAVDRGELPPPFWAFAWAGGMALARHLLAHPELVAGRQVVDVATGSGVVAVAAARAGAREVVASDIDEFAITAVALNARLNRVRVEPRLADVREIHVQPGAVVTAGDVFYDRDIASAMITGLGSLRLAGAEVLVGDPHRSFLPEDRLEPLAFYDVEVEEDLENATLKHTVVARLVEPAGPRSSEVHGHQKV